MLQVSAEDKASGKAQKITITSDKGRLSQSEIERMIREAEENAEIDRIARLNVEAKNQLETYIYSLRSSLSDSAVKDKLSDDDKDTLNKGISEVLSWLEAHGSEDKDTYDGKRKELEDIANPILSKASSASGAGSSPGAEPSPGESNSNEEKGPTVEEM